ncbi:unnamed protein product, partial [Candidula unifasciata]
NIHTQLILCRDFNKHSHRKMQDISGENNIKTGKGGRNIHPAPPPLLPQQARRNLFAVHGQTVGSFQQTSVK